MDLYYSSGQCFVCVLFNTVPCTVYTVNSHLQLAVGNEYCTTECNVDVDNRTVSILLYIGKIIYNYNYNAPLLSRRHCTADIAKHCL